MKKYLSIMILASIMVFTIAIYQYFKFHDGMLHVVICDVGQGDAIYIRTPEAKDVLIDGGPDEKVLDCLSSNMPFWDRSIENVFMTHPDADHLTGLTYVLERYDVKSFSTQSVPSKTQVFKKLEATLAEKKVSARYLQVGDSFEEASGLSFQTLWPTPQAISAMKLSQSKNLSLNELSVTQTLRYGDFQLLFTGDESLPVGEIIAPLAGDVDVLKVPHHGSKYGMSSKYLNILKPDLAVLSVGARNRYGHPASLSLELLNKAGVKILRTDLDGELEIISDGKTWKYLSEKRIPL